MDAQGIPAEHEEKHLHWGVSGTDKAERVWSVPHWGHSEPSGHSRGTSQSFLDTILCSGMALILTGDIPDPSGHSLGTFQTPLFTLLCPGMALILTGDIQSPLDTLWGHSEPSVHTPVPWDVSDPH